MVVNFEKAEKELKQFIAQYDIQNPQIKLKMLHMQRVAKNCRLIAERLELYKDYQDVAELIGMLHDIGKFEQYVNSQVKNRDHGEYAINILEKEMRKYIFTDKYDNIIKKAIKNHNKYEIEKNLTEDEKLFAKLIRDADKLDIFYECTEIFWKDSEEKVNKSKISLKIYDNMYKNQIIKIEENRDYNTIDDLLITLSYMFDINYKPTYEIIQKEDYVNKIFNRFNLKDVETKEKVEEIIIHLNTYIQKKIEEKV